MEYSKFNIKLASKKSGLTPFTIRTWEKRYKILNPERSDSNRRLYSSEDINKLILLKRAVDSGHSIGNLAHLSTEQLEELLEIKKPNDLISPNIGDSKSIIQNLVKYIENFDDKGIDKILFEAGINFSANELLDNLIIPLLSEIGSRWAEGKLRISHEHFATYKIRNFLLNLYESYKYSEESPKMIVTTPVGQVHELGAIIASIKASIRGYKTIYLGGNLPADEIASAAVQINANVICLSIVYTPDETQLIKDLIKLSKLVSNRKIILSGLDITRFTKYFSDNNIYFVENFDEFNEKLDKLKSNIP